MSFTFELVLGDHTVKRVTFNAPKARFQRRDIKTSTGYKVGQLVLTQQGLRLELDEDTASLIADAEFH